VQPEPETTLGEPQHETPVFPENAAKDFKWEDSFAEEKNYEERIRKFCEENKHLNLDADVLLKDIKKASDLGRELFEISGTGKSEKINYHDAKHGELTAVPGLEMYLVALKTLAVEPKYKDYIAANAQRLVTTNLVAYNLHEMREWWMRDASPEIQEAMTVKLNERLTEMSVEAADMDLIVELDDFPKTLNESMEVMNTSGLTEKSVFSGDPEIRKALAKESGACLRTADFMQTLNANYMDRVMVAGIDATPVELTRGPVALAQEFLNVRQKALPPDWIKLNGNGKVTINWINVGMSRFIYEQKVIPNLAYGEKYLQEINPKAYTEIQNRKAKLKEIMEKDEARKAEYKERIKA
jgi:hypothetical protein